MKRVLILTCAALMALGLAGLADNGQPDGTVLEDGVETHIATAQFDIAGQVIIFVANSGVFKWLDGSDVGEPGAEDAYDTEALSFTLYNNVRDLDVTFTGEPFRLMDNGGVVDNDYVTTLATKLSVAQTPLGNLDDVDLKAQASGQWTGVAPGTYTGTLTLNVDRNGYDDPAGSYEAEVAITVTGI